MELPVTRLSQAWTRRTAELAASAILVGLVAYSLFWFPWLERVECLRSGPLALKILTIAWDAAFFTAYAWIPFELILIWLRLEIRPGGRLLILYGAFIVLCGLTHGMTILNFHHPLYWVAMKLKALGGAVSIAVAYVTRKKKPDLLALGRQGAELRAATEKAERLQREAEERTQRLEAMQQELQESVRIAEAARKQAEGAVVDLAAALGEKEQAIREKSAALVELNIARDQAAQRAQRAEGNVGAMAAERDQAAEHARELRELNAQLQRALAEGAAASERIAHQAAAIEELETPVTPLWEGVLLCPMVGPMDSERARRLMETLLAAVVAHSARVVILDLTGVSVVDSAVAARLSMTARAVRLVGSECIITGVSGPIATTIVSLGLELNIETRRDVQQGLALATQRIKAIGKHRGP